MSPATRRHRSKPVVWSTGEREQLLTAAAEGHVHRTDSGYDMWRNPPSRRTGVDYMPRRVDRKVAQLAALGLLELRPDSTWRPTNPAERTTPA